MGIGARIIDAYQEALESHGESAAERAISLAILSEILAAEVLTSGPRAHLQNALRDLEAGPLTEAQASAYGDHVVEYLTAKNGSAALVSDAEDGALKAALEAFQSSMEWDGLEGVALAIEDLLTT